MLYIVAGSGVIASYSAFVKLTIFSTLSAQVIHVVSETTANGSHHITTSQAQSFRAYCSQSIGASSVLLVLSSSIAPCTSVAVSPLVLSYSTSLAVRELAYRTTIVPVVA